MHEINKNSKKTEEKESKKNKHKKPGTFIKNKLYCLLPKRKEARNAPPKRLKSY